MHHLYPVRTVRRDALRLHLARDGVGTGIHYPVPAHRQPALRQRPHRCTSQKVTEEACLEVLSLPIYPELREEQLELVARSVRGFFAAVGEAVG